MDWHPHADSYPLLEGEEFEAFKRDIAVNGQQETAKYRMVNGSRQGLDGRNRERACDELGIECRYEKASVADADVQAFIDSRNLHRRHLTREQRQARVQVMRAGGQSTRQIAASLGVSQSTVINDIKDAELSAGEQNCSPERNTRSATSPNPPALHPPLVIGQDGKSYSANRSPEADGEPEVPERLKPFFESVPLFERAARLAVCLANLFQEIEQTPAYRKAVEGEKHAEYSTYIRSAGRAIAAMTPKRACPECGGAAEPSLDNDSCKSCLDRGYQTAEEVDE